METLQSKCTLFKTIFLVLSDQFKETFIKGSILHLFA
jgi:hypothetical protein